jgi:hypothetical protein
VIITQNISTSHDYSIAKNIWTQKATNNWRKETGQEKEDKCELDCTYSRLDGQVLMDTSKSLRVATTREILLIS